MRLRVVARTPERWQQIRRRAKHVCRAVAGVACSNDPHLVLRWALRGLGMALLPSTLVANHLVRGDLVAILPGILRTEGTVSLVMLERKLLPPAVRAFVEFVTHRAPSAPRTPSATDDER